MELRKRRQINYEDGRSGANAESDEISDDSSAGGAIPVVCKPTRRISAPAKSKRAEKSRKKGSFTDSEVEDDPFQPRPVARNRYARRQTARKTVRRSSRMPKVNYREASSEDEEADFEKSDEEVPDSEDSDASGKQKVRRKVDILEEISDSQEKSDFCDGNAVKNVHDSVSAESSDEKSDFQETFGKRRAEKQRKKVGRRGKSEEDTYSEGNSGRKAEKERDESWSSGSEESTEEKSGLDASGDLETEAEQKILAGLSRRLKSEAHEEVSDSEDSTKGFHNGDASKEVPDSEEAKTESDISGKRKTVKERKKFGGRTNRELVPESEVSTDGSSKHEVGGIRRCNRKRAKSDQWDSDFLSDEGSLKPKTGKLPKVVNGVFSRRPKRTCVLKTVQETKPMLDIASSGFRRLRKHPSEKVEVKTYTRRRKHPGLMVESSKEEAVKSTTYMVCKYGLEVDGEFPPVVKPQKQQVEKILGVRNRANGNGVYCVKLWNRSYRNAVSVDEDYLQKKYPILLRNFQKRMDSLGRVDGHVGNVEEAPAFDPQYLVVDRFIASEFRGRIKKFYVKWKNLPYTDATWELEEFIVAEREARKRFEAVNNQQPGCPCDVLSGFKDGRSLRDYQKDGVVWLDRNFQRKINCILADEMGLGKTIQSVAMLENLRLKRKIKGPFLVVAPVSTLGHWQREIESLTDMNCVVYVGTQEDRSIIQQYEFWAPKGNSPKFTVLLSSYEILLKDRRAIDKIAWQYVIIDEAHRLKSKSSKTSSALGCLDIRKGGLLLLTGTPIQNNTKELFGLLSFLDREEFESEEDFMQKYGNIKDIEQVKDLQENVLKPRLLRRMKEDVEKSIPLKEETIIWVELTKEQRAYYRAIYENRISDLMKGSSCSNMPNLRNIAMALRQLCNHPFTCKGLEEDYNSKFPQATESSNLVQSSGKMVLLSKLLPMLRDANRRVLIFSQFTQMLDILEEYLSSEGYTYERIDGNVRGAERQAAIDRYSAIDSKTFAFLLSTKAGGLGITLTAADTCIIYDSDWNPQNDLQAMARCHRIGQTKDVKIYRLITRNTYEQHLFECSSRKYGLDEAVLGKFEEHSDSAKNIENLLRHGAYDILKEEGEAEAAAFGAENIDHILQQRTQKRTIGGRGNNTFSVATFMDTNGIEDVKAENFWKTLLPEVCEQQKDDDEVRMFLGPRKRRKVDYEEKEQSVEDSDDTESNADGEGNEEDSQPPTIDRTPWTSKEINRLERSLFKFGTVLSEVELATKAGLENRDLSEVKGAVDAIVQLCHYFQAKEDLQADPLKPTLPPNVESAINSSSLLQRIERNPKKCLRIFHELEVIAAAVEKQNLKIQLPRSKNLPLWWGEAEDIDLLKGVHRHGHKAFKHIRTDPALCFVLRITSTEDEPGGVSDWPSNTVLSSRVKNLVKEIEKPIGNGEERKPSGNDEQRNTVSKDPALKKHKKVSENCSKKGRVPLLNKSNNISVTYVANSSDEEKPTQCKKVLPVKSAEKIGANRSKVESHEIDKQENKTPGSLKRKTSGGQQQSLLGYFTRS